MASEKQWLILTGRLGKDIEEKTSAKGTSYLSFRFASDCGSETMWYSVLVFGEKVSPARKFFKKGDRLELNTEMLNPHTLKLLDFKFPMRTATPVAKAVTEVDVDELLNDDVSDFPFGEVKEIEY